MRFSYAILADAVNIGTGGKINMLGAGIDAVYSSDLTQPLPPMSLVVGLLAGPGDCGREHKIRAEFLAPDGTEFDPPVEMKLTPYPHPRHPDRELTSGFVVQMNRVTAHAFGDHTIRIFVDGNCLAENKFEVFPRPGSEQKAE